MAKVLNLFECIILLIIGYSLCGHYNPARSSPSFYSQSFPLRLILDLITWLAIGMRFVSLFKKFKSVDTAFQKLYPPLILYTIGISFDVWIYLKWILYANVNWYLYLIFIYSIPILILLGKIFYGKQRLKPDYDTKDILDVD